MAGYAALPPTGSRSSVAAAQTEAGPAATTATCPQAQARRRPYSEAHVVVPTFEIASLRNHDLTSTECPNCERQANETPTEEPDAGKSHVRFRKEREPDTARVYLVGSPFGNIEVRGAREN